MCQPHGIHNGLVHSDRHQSNRCQVHHDFSKKLLLQLLNWRNAGRSTKQSTIRLNGFCPTTYKRSVSFFQVCVCADAQRCIGEHQHYWYPRNPVWRKAEDQQRLVVNSLYSLYHEGSFDFPIFLFFLHPSSPSQWLSFCPLPPSWFCLMIILIFVFTEKRTKVLL